MSRGRMKRGRSTTKHARRERDFTRMGWVRSQSCCCREPQPHIDGVLYAFEQDRCQWGVQAHHAGDRFEEGDGYRGDDDTVIPLCKRHHDLLHARRGPFLGWSKPTMRAWQDAWIAVFRARYAVVLGTGEAVPW